MTGRQVTARVVNVDEQSGRVVLSGGRRCRFFVCVMCINCAWGPNLVQRLALKCASTSADFLELRRTCPCPPASFQSVQHCLGRRSLCASRPRCSSCRRPPLCWGKQWMPRVRAGAAMLLLARSYLGFFSQVVHRGHAALPFHTRLTHALVSFPSVSLFCCSRQCQALWLLCRVSGECHACSSSSSSSSSRHGRWRQQQRQRRGAAGCAGWHAAGGPCAPRRGDVGPFGRHHAGGTGAVA